MRVGPILLLAACSRAPEGPPRLVIAGGIAHWTRAGFVELVPSILPPSTPDGSDQIHVFYKLPPDATFEVGDGPTVKAPPGTEADRVETEAGRVIDVRGTRFDGDRELFHVLRPQGDELVGTEWPRDDGPAATAATERLSDALRAQAPPGEDPSRTEARVRRFDALNACATCHAHGQAQAAEPDRRRPNRATDGSGLYLVLATLADEAPVETYRPYDLNADNPFITATCGAAPAELHRDPAGGRRFVCADGTVAVAHLDVRAARAGGDAHALAVCASRAYLHAHLDAAGRRAFARSFDECGLR